MRRKDREVLDFGAMIQIVDACTVCRLGLADEGSAPYIVPMNFGYEVEGEDLTLYFHGSKEGRKISLIRKNGGLASFEMDCGHGLLESDAQACGYSYYYESVCGTGRIEVLEEAGEKERALRTIMRHYTDRTGLPMNEKILERTCVMSLRVEEWTCKRH